MVTSQERFEELKNNFELKRKTKMITLTIDESREIDRPLVSDIYNLLEELSRETTTQDLDVFVHSSGGDADAAYQIGKMFQSYCKGKLTFIIPRYAKSAATLLTCAGDEIIMDEPSELGPVDPQIIDYFRGVRYSALSIENTILFLDKIEKKCNPEKEECNKVIREAIRNIPLMEIGDDLRALNHIREYLNELLESRMFKEELKENKEETKRNINKIIHDLLEGHYSHGKCITYQSALTMGLKIKRLDKADWKIIWEMFRIFEKEVLMNDNKSI